MEDITDSLRASGIDRLAIVNGHGGNYVLANVVQEANVRGPSMTLFPNRQDWETARAASRATLDASYPVFGLDLRSRLRSVVIARS